MALGVFILWFCWFGFNGGSTVSMTGDDTMVSAGLICFNTNLAAALATVAALIVSWVRYGKPDVSLTFNGALAGLVAITAGCDVVDPFGAATIGIVAGVLCIFSVEFFDNVAKIDDPVGAVSVHCMNGAWGTIAVGLFATEGACSTAAALPSWASSCWALSAWRPGCWPRCSSSSRSSKRPSAARLREGGDRRPGLPRARPGQRLCTRHQ